MQNQVLLVIFLFFGFAFLVYLFPVIFVEAAKLQSGVTIKAPSIAEPEMICDDTIDNDNDGKIDADDEDCAAPPAGPAAGTCGLQIVSGVPINYGQLPPVGNWMSALKKIVIKNEGISGTAANASIMIKGGDWIIDAGNSSISGPEATYVNGYSLTSNGGVYGQIAGGESIPLYFQLLTWVSAPSGSYHQEVTIDLLC